jgi:transcriptional regulator with XRE-family HTH domain
VDEIRFGGDVRLLRHRKGWRQLDLAAAAGVSRGVVARVEAGRASRVTVATLERIAAPLGARVGVRLLWQGEGLDRLRDAAHASLVERTLRALGANGWQTAPEVSFSVYGERGSIDVLAFHPATAALIVVEVKSTVPDVQATLVVLDRKQRLGTGIAAERGWRATSVGRLLVVGESRTARRRIEAHATTFGTAFPQQGWLVRRWLAAPDPARPLQGLWFLSGEPQASVRRRIVRTTEGRQRGGRRRS